MLTAIALVVLAIFCRLLSPEFHIWNFVPAGRWRCTPGRGCRGDGPGPCRWQPWSCRMRCSIMGSTGPCPS